MDFAGAAYGNNFKVGLCFVEELTHVAPGKPEVSDWSSNETTPTGDRGFSPAKAKPTKELSKTGKKISNWERRDKLLKFAEALKAGGMTVPPTFSVGISTPSATHNFLEHNSSMIASFPDIPSWLRSRRLQKYDDCFQGISWPEMFKFTEADLEDRGVYTVGARGRLMKSLNELRKRQGSK
ncbi:hypothetical protein B0H10DRAFT_1955325 [Mycena sp. CBHHK59/15]|nr:hypothetical protein B0H10DRAFT_1959886 [Mycena sp. CBHHK59/15]KAJ6608551.1 hypothetical protein B0H10DRAFT_1955325 [Mycena sp. CBHHK59/15]